MQLFKRALTVFGVKPVVAPSERQPDYPVLMQDALERLRNAELQIQEATTLEDLDIGRSALLSAQAEVQQLVRNAKREQGISVRPISETEEIHRNLRNYMNHKAAAGDGMNHSSGLST